MQGVSLKPLSAYYPSWLKWYIYIQRMYFFYRIVNSMICFLIIAHRTSFQNILMYAVALQTVKEQNCLSKLQMAILVRLHIITKHVFDNANIHSY